jgi:hypothetical protein
MRMNTNELSLDELEKVCGSGFGVVTRVKGCPIRGPRGPHSGASGSSGDGDTQLGSDPGGTSDGGGGGYKGDDNYLHLS